VTLAKDAGLDLVRVNAHIGRPELYDAADRAGMVVWQDLPLHRGYARGIRKQAVRQAREAVDLLAHHPSIVVWCGHDEPFSIDGPGGGGSASVVEGKTLLAQELPTWNKSVLDRSVKRALERNDGTRPVIAHSGVLPHPPMLDGTDSHLFFGWLHGDRRDLGGLARAMPRVVRFVSAFGAGAVPESADFMAPERWPDLDWDELEARHGLHRDAFTEHVPPTDHPTFDSWRRASQAYQATVIRRQIEALRRLKYRPVGGFAQLQLADAQPSVGWSVLDHERKPKAGHQALIDACRPVIVVADEPAAELVAGTAIALDVHVVSDRRTPIEGAEARATLRWEGGEQRWRFGGDLDADAVQRVGTLAIEVPDAPGPMYLDLHLTGPDVDATNTYESQIVRA
jgi:beta-mannosidase